jgi:tetratricopeptide (TPR) repeat protein
MAHDKRTRQKLDAELAVLLKKGRLQRAALVLRTILEKDQDDDRLFIKLAEVSQKLGDEDGVRAAFRSAAIAAEKKGFYLRAMASLRQLARYLEPQERPWSELADLALRLGLVGDALGFLDEGIRAWEAVGDRPAMLKANRRAHELAPDDVHRTLRLSLELRAGGRRDEALSLLTAEATRHRAAGRPEAWLHLASELSSLSPTDRGLACEVSAAYLDRGEPRQALKRLQSLLRERAQHVESLRLLVRTFEALGQPSKRLAALRELARTVASRGREAEARLLWREIQQAAPDDAEARRALGMGPALQAVAPAPRPTLDPPAPSRPSAAPNAQASAQPPVSPAAGPPLQPRAPAAFEPLPFHDFAVPGEPPPRIVPAPEQDEEELVDLTGDGVEVESEDEPALVAPLAAQVTPAAPVLVPPLLVERSTPPPPMQFIATPPPGSPFLAPVDLSLLELDPEPPAPGALPEGFEDDLAHADFLVVHRFVDEARELLATLEEASPGHAGVAALSARLASGPELVRPHPSATIASSPSPEVDLTPLPRELPADEAQLTPSPGDLSAAGFALTPLPGDLKAAGFALTPLPVERPGARMQLTPRPGDLDASWPLLTPPPFDDAAEEHRPAAAPDAEEVHDADTLGAVELIPASEVLARFQEQVALAVAPDDAATHYDLGIAYREMGLVTEALAEFEIALPSAVGARAIDCLVGVALCEAARGDLPRATRVLKRALAHEALTPPAAAAVLYELGLLREQAGDAPGAAWAFDASERSQPRFRDAAARARGLRPAALPSPPPGAGPGPAPGPAPAGA